MNLYEDEMKKACVIGHFGFGESLLNGQTVKTKIITNGLRNLYGQDEIVTVDTHGSVRKRLCCIAKFVVWFRKCKNVIMLPAQNGIRIFTPIILVLNRFFRKKLHYIVIGGWLANYLIDKPHLTNELRRFDGIYVEADGMKAELCQQGFENIVVMPNCKELGGAVVA